MNTSHLEQIIKRGHSKEFFDSFEDAFDLMDFSCEKTGNNAFHLLAKYGKREFVEEILNHYENFSKNAVGLMLIAKNNDGIIPANMKKDEKKPVLSSKKLGRYMKYMRETEEFALVRNILKRKTKQFIYQNENKNALFHIGTQFKQGIPLETRFGSSDNAFMTEIPVYPSVKLVNYDTSPHDDFGLSGDKKNTLYINFIEEIHSNTPDKAQLNKGEFVDLGNVNMNENLATYASQSLAFADDFEKNISVLNILGKELKSGFSDDVLAPLYQRFASKGGVFVVENQNKPYMNSNTIEKSRYAGATAEKRDVFTAGFVRLIYLNAENGKTTNKADFVNTIRHELTHCADEDFSSSDISGYFFAIKCAKDKEKNPLFKTFEYIAKNYKNKSFKSEALANIVALNSKDELSKEFVKLFSNYTKTKLYNKSELWHEALSSALHDMPKECKKFLNKAENKLSSNIKYDYSTDYASSHERDKIQTEITPVFLSTLKMMNQNIEKEISRFEKSSSLRQNNEKSVEDAFIANSIDIEKCQNNVELQDMLEKQLEDYSSKDASKIQLFKIAMTSEALHKKEFPELQNDSRSLSFKNKESFYALLEDDIKNTKIIRNANKLCRTLSDFNNEEITRTSAKIALCTEMSGKGVENTLNKVNDVMENMTRKEKISLLRTEIVKHENVLKGIRSKENDTLNLLRIVKIAENISRDSHFKIDEIPPTKFNLANYDNLSKDGKFKNSLFSLVRNEQKPFEKQWVSGQQNSQNQLLVLKTNSLSR